MRTYCALDPHAADGEKRPQLTAQVSRSPLTLVRRRVRQSVLLDKAMMYTSCVREFRTADSSRNENRWVSVGS